jgi:glycosyltransferase involved in cell wall biosynthesis
MAKRLSYALLESSVLRHARMLHFTSSQEANEAFELDSRLQKVPVMTLPLPIQIPVHLSNHPFLEKYPQLKATECVLFLSRFSRQKGLELLLEAFAALSSRDGGPILVLAGGGDEKYVESLRVKAVLLGIDDRILWTGYLTGNEKYDALESATVFVLPSYSESFGIAAAEALASGCASILSDGIPFARDAAGVGAAVVTKCDSGSLREALEQVLGSATQRESLGRNARRFAEEHFSPPAIAATLINAYAEIAGNVVSSHVPVDHNRNPT